jgi:hypothetical protein
MTIIVALLVSAVLVYLLRGLIGWFALLVVVCWLFS